MVFDAARTALEVRLARAERKGLKDYMARLRFLNRNIVLTRDQAWGIQKELFWSRREVQRLKSVISNRGVLARRNS